MALLTMFKFVTNKLHKSFEIILNKKSMIRQHSKFNSPYQKSMIRQNSKYNKAYLQFFPMNFTMKLYFQKVLNNKTDFLKNEITKWHYWNQKTNKNHFHEEKILCSSKSISFEIIDSIHCVFTKKYIKL